MIFMIICVTQESMIFDISNLIAIARISECNDKIFNKMLSKYVSQIRKGFVENVCLSILDQLLKIASVFVL